MHIYAQIHSQRQTKNQLEKNKKKEEERRKEMESSKCRRRKTKRFALDRRE